MVVYINQIQNSIQRLLSLGDSNPVSPTFGCFDRNFWHYRTVTDFPSAPFQMAALSLALLYQNDFENNFCYRRPEILRLAEGAMLYWAKIQRADGSFDEWYPYEHSFVATAFTSYGVSEALLLLKDELSKETSAKVTRSLEKAASWLSRHDDLLVSNHQAGAVPALYNIFLLTRKEKYRELAQEKLDKLLSVQTEEGWFPEYGGADPGYTSLTVDFLAKYYQKSQDEKAREAINKALDFMVYFLHPDGSFGGEYGSRNTKYLFPHGLEILSAEFPQAGYLLQPFYQPKKYLNLVNLNSVDDRFLVFFFLPNYLQALVESAKREKEPDFSFVLKSEEKNFPLAGLLVRKDEFNHLIINFKKGGVMKVFTADKLLYSDSGYFGILNNGKVVTTQWLNQDVTFQQSGENEFLIKTQFTLADFSLPLVRYLVPFRTFTSVFGFSDRIMGAFGRQLKKRKILTLRRLPLFLERKVILGFREVKIEDKISSQGLKISSLEIGSGSSALHVPSSRFSTNSLNYTFSFSEEIIKSLNEGKPINLITEISLSKKEVKYSFGAV